MYSPMFSVVGHHVHRPAIVHCTQFSKTFFFKYILSVCGDAVYQDS